MCDAVPVMDKAAEKAGLERLLGTAGTLGLQQLDDMQTKEDSPDAGGDQSGGDDKAEQSSGAVSSPDAGPSSCCVNISRRAAPISDRSRLARRLSVEPAPRIIDYCPRSASPSNQMLTSLVPGQLQGPPRDSGTPTTCTRTAASCIRRRRWPTARDDRLLQRPKRRLIG